MPCKGPRKRSRFMSPSTSLAAFWASLVKERARALYCGPKVSSRWPKSLVNSTHEICRFRRVALSSVMVAKARVASSILVPTFAMTRLNFEREGGLNVHGYLKLSEAVAHAADVCI